MITNIIILMVTLGLSTIGISAVVKEKRRKQKQLQIAEAYERLVRQCKLAIEYSEFLRNRYIGLDRKNKKLVFIDHCDNQKQEQCISLHEIAESRIVHLNDESQHIQFIALELVNKYNNKPVRFCFFNKDYDPPVELPSLKRKAVQWKTKVDIHKQPGNVGLEAEYVL